MDASIYGTLYQTLQRTAGKHGNRPAYAVPPMAKRAYYPAGWEVTFEQTRAAVEEMKRAYQRAGYGYGHRVAILFDQRPEFFFHYYALNALGASVVPVNPDYRVDEIRYVVEHSEAILAIAIESRLADMRAATQDIAVRPPVVAFERSFEDLPSAQRPPQSATPAFDTEAALLYTSGTTGRPKGCILTNEYFHSFGACYLSLGGRLDFREGQERLYNPLPLHHANCLSVSSSALLLCGGCLIFPDRFHASTWWKDLITTRATAAQFQGIIPNILLKLPLSPEERQHSVRFSLCAGIEPSQHEVFEQRYGFPVVEMWAMTETGRLISDSVEPRAIHTRSFGRPNAWVEVRIVDEQNRDVPPNQPGEMVIRHSAAHPRKGFFSGYLKNAAATEEAWRNGWFHTGDAVVRDESGTLYFVDRKKNIIRRSGENIAAAEIEACLTAHDKVKQVAVLAAPDEIREQAGSCSWAACPPAPRQRCRKFTSSLRAPIRANSPARSTCARRRSRPERVDPRRTATMHASLAPDTAAGVIARFLKARGVDRIFGLCGGHIMPIWMCCDAQGIRIIDVRDERAAVYMMRPPRFAIIGGAW